jgi:hypothetical protein
MLGKGTETYLEALASIVPGIDSVLVLTRIRVQLPAVDFDGLENERTVCKFLVTAMLPLHYAFGTSGYLC